MITTKQRSSLRALAQSLTPVVIIGKEGITENVIASVRDVIDARELIKIRILNNCSLSTREISDQLCSALSAEPVQCIGSTVVIYKRSLRKDIEHVQF